MQTIETNQYGNVDIRAGVPKGLTHIPKATYGNLKIGVLCKQLYCPSAPAVTGFRKSGKFWKSITDGVVVPIGRSHRVLSDINDRLAAKKAKVQRPQIDPFADLALKYGTPQNALLDAATAMLDLNRQAKRCSKSESQEIYALKSRFIRMLYEDGKCMSVQRHLLTLPAKECRACWGCGCDRCNDTGEYLPAKTLTNYVFTFKIYGVRFCWHQPQPNVTFPVTVTLPDGVMPVLISKPLVTRKSQLTEAMLPETQESQLTDAMLLVTWVVDNLKHESAGLAEAETSLAAEDAVPVLNDAFGNQQAFAEAS